MQTDVCIIGAGPAGLLLAALLAKSGVESVVLESRDRAYIEARLRAGVLEQGTQDLLRAAGVSARMDREGLVHEGVELAHNGRRVAIDLKGLSGGKTVMVYGQTQVVQDLVADRLESGREIRFGSADVVLHDVATTAPSVSFTCEGLRQTVHCAAIAGCDGFHGVSRAAIPADILKVYERVYPFAWLGILADCAPPSNELIYARHERGFALYSMRAPTIARHYIQCRPEEDIAAWPDDRIWDELDHRIGKTTLPRGKVRDKGITPMRSFVAEPMRHGRLFLAGDAAHIVPPTGAKGLNLAAGDVHYLAEALLDYFRSGSETGFDAYSARALARVWKAQRFSWWMTSMLHRFDAGEPFTDRIHQAEFEYVLSSEAALRTLAENYVGLPY